MKKLRGYEGLYVTASKGRHYVRDPKGRFVTHVRSGRGYMSRIVHRVEEKRRPVKAPGRIERKRPKERIYKINFLITVKYPKSRRMMSNMKHTPRLIDYEVELYRRHTDIEKLKSGISMESGIRDIIREANPDTGFQRMIESDNTVWSFSVGFSDIEEVDTEFRDSVKVRRFSDWREVS